MDRLQVQLVIGLDRHKTHVLAFDSLGDGFGINEVVLVDERLYKLTWNQLHVVALLAQSTAEEMSSGAGFQELIRLSDWPQGAAESYIFAWLTRDNEPLIVEQIFTGNTYSLQVQ